MTEKHGATTTDLRVAVEEVGFKSKKAISRAIAITRAKLEKEGIMPETTKKTKKTRKPRKSSHKDEISKLRTDIAELKSQMKSLDTALRREQGDTVPMMVVRGALVGLKTATYPVHSPIKSVKGVWTGTKAVYHGLKVATFWSGRQVKKPLSWLASKFVRDTEAPKAPTADEAAAIATDAPPATA